MSRQPTRPPLPIIARSFDSIVFATRQPSLTGPSRHASGIATSVKNTSLKCAIPLIWRSGRTSMPGVCMSSRNAVMPLCFGASRSVRASNRPQSL